MNKKDQLEQYINQNNIEALESLLEKDPKLKIAHQITENTEVLLSPLHYAAMQGKLEVCKALYTGGSLECEELTSVMIDNKKIEIGEDQEHQYYRDPKGNIHEFFENSSGQIVARPFSLVKFTPLEYAIAYGHKEVVEYFLRFEENHQNIERLLAFAFYYNQSQKLIESMLRHVEPQAIGERCLMKSGYELIYTPVAYAILNDNVEMLELLKREKFSFIEESLTAEFKKSSKPILFAVENNQEKCVKWLLANKVSLICCGQGRTENILCAATHASIGILSQILNHLIYDEQAKKYLLVGGYSNPFPSPLLEAVKQEDSEYIKTLMPHYNGYLKSYHPEDRRKFVLAVLSKAVKHKKVGNLKLLLNYRIMSDNVDERRLVDTCVSKAIETNSTEYIQALIDMNIPIVFYSSCILEAVQKCVSKHFLEYLLDKGGKEHIDTTGVYDRVTALMESLRTNQRELMNVLLDFGADASSEVGGYLPMQPGAPGIPGQTPLHYAIESGANVDTIRAFLEHRQVKRLGKEIFTADVGDGTPLNVAKQKNRGDIVELLEEAAQKDSSFSFFSFSYR